MKRLPAYPLFLTMSGAYGLFWSIIVTVNLVYQVETVGLNPLQLVLVGTLLESTAFLAEVPTGILADLRSRRLSVILGVTLTGLGFALEGSVPHFAAVLAAQVIWGVGATFISGAREAWVAGELGEERAGPAFLRGSQLESLGQLAGIPISVALASVNLQLAIVTGAALMVVLAVFLSLTMPEDNFSPTQWGERTTFAAMWDVFRSGLRVIRRRPALITILAVTVFYGMSGEGLDRLSTAHFIQTIGLPPLGRFEPVVWFGVISAVATVLGVAAVEAARRWLDLSNEVRITRTLMAVNAMLVAGTVAFGLAGNLAVGLAAFWLVRALRNANGPILTAWMNRHVDPAVKATVFSMGGQVDALGQIGGGPAIGLIGTVVSLRAAMLAAAALMAPAFAIYTRSLRDRSAGASTRVAD